MPYKGGKRRKNRTHKAPLPNADASIPKSFVVRRGKVDTSVKELVVDLREVMLPHTAERLRERKSNTFKDFVAIAGTLHVSHLLLLSQTEGGNVNLRIGRLPRGPTLTFRIDQYTTSRLVRASRKAGVDVDRAFEHPPLVVLHNFGAGGEAPAAPPISGVSLADALRMAQATFQAMFPPLNPATVRLDACRRVLLVHYNKGTGKLELRHYLVRAVPVGVTRGVRKLAVQSRLPDLSRLDDVASFVLSGGRTGGGATSESEAEDEAARVTLPHNFGGRGNVRSELSTIKLAEIGPRLSLTLVKIEAGLCEGDVLYHAFVSKTSEEAANLRARATERARLKAERKATQAANVAVKAEAEAGRKASKEAMRAERQEKAEKAAADGTFGEEEEEEVRGGGAGKKRARPAGDTDGYENDGEAASADEEEEDEEDEEEGAGAGAPPSGRMDVGDTVGQDDEIGGEEEEEEEGEGGQAPAPPPQAGAKRSRVEAAGASSKRARSSAGGEGKRGRGGLAGGRGARGGLAKRN